ncbi:7372_t:CDS:2, partial [Gigaspora margarita]
MDLRTSSDHQAVFVQLETELNLRKRSQAENQKKEYQDNLNKELKRKLSKNIEKENVQRDILDYKLLENKTLDKLWDIIKNSIKKSAANTLPQKKKTHFRKLRKNKEKEISVQEVEELEQFIELLKNCWGLEVVEVVKQDYSTVSDNLEI